MSRKFACLIIALTFLGLLAACGNKNQSAEKSNATPAAPSTTTEGAAPSSANAPGSANVPGTAEPELVNVPAGDNVVLPADIPAYPNAELTGKRITNQIHIFDYKAKANMRDVNKFYNTELRNRGWKELTQLPNSTDGLYFAKADRTVRVITINHREVECEIHLFVAEPQKVVDTETVKGDKGEDTSVPIGNLQDLVKHPKDITNVPFYPNAEAHRSEHPDKWNEYTSPDSVKTIASWYAEKMKENGWQVELDTSEMGDSMVIYKRDDDQGNKRHVGVRVNDMKDHRNLTLIFFPKNITIPHVKPLSEVAGSQPEAAKAVAEAVKKAEVDKEKAMKEAKKGQ